MYLCICVGSKLLTHSPNAPPREKMVLDRALSHRP